MKTLIATATVFSLLAGFAMAQVTTRNAAGYAKVNIGPNKLELVSNPFDTFDGSPHNITNLVVGSPDFIAGTVVFKFDFGRQEYLTSTLRDVFGNRFWSDPLPPESGDPDAATIDTLNFNRGEGFFIQTPSADTQSHDWFAHGQVPDTDTASTSTTPLSSGALSMYGFPYPVARNATQTHVSVNAVSGDVISFWDQSADSLGGWVDYTFRDVFGARSWEGPGGADESTMLFTPGKAFIYSRTSSAGADAVWTEDKIKYYSWP